MRHLLFLAFFLLSFPAHAELRAVAAPTDLNGTVTIDGAGTLTGAKWACLTLYPTTPDGDLVADTDVDRIVVRKAFTVTNVYAYVNVTGTTSAPTFDLNEDGTTILSTKLTIDANENDSSTAATAAVISDSAIAANAVLSVDVDSADSGDTAAGAEVQACGYYN